MIKSPIHPFFDFGDQPRVSGEIRKRHQAVQKVRSTLPTFAGAAQPPTICTQVRPELVQMTAQSVSLNPQLLEQPTGWLDGSERKQVE